MEMTMSELESASRKELIAHLSECWEVSDEDLHEYSTSELREDVRRWLWNDIYALLEAARWESERYAAQCRIDDTSEEG
jgi:hypothetical protein